MGSEAALVEISDERGHTLEELELPLDMLRPLSSPSQEQLPDRDDALEAAGSRE